MRKLYIDSPAVSSISYDCESKALEISYYNKGTYQYTNVPFVTYQRLIVAKDKQQYADRYVTGKYITIKKD